MNIMTKDETLRKQASLMYKMHCDWILDLFENTYQAVAFEQLQRSFQLKFRSLDDEQQKVWDSCVEELREKGFVVEQNSDMLFVSW